MENNPINEAAARWVIRHQDGTLTDAERSQFDAWMAADVRHAGAFHRLGAVAVDLERLAALSAGKLPQLADDAPANPGRRWAIAAGIGTLLAGATAWLLPKYASERYASGVGELRLVPLQDGSKMTLNTSTDLRVRFSETERSIQLSQGEALFEVAKDRARPFVVRAGDVTVTAVGTAFAVKVRDGRAEVTVTEGLVQLQQAGESDPRLVSRVGANQRASVVQAKAIEVQAVAPDEVERRLAWLDGMVAFDGESLADAVAEVNAHNRRRIVIADPELAVQPIIGVFRADEIETFARTAAEILGARVVEDGDTISLQRGSP